MGEGGYGRRKGPWMKEEGGRGQMNGEDEGQVEVRMKGQMMGEMSGAV
jgi:hypothetical protein